MKNTRIMRQILTTFDATPSCACVRLHKFLTPSYRIPTESLPSPALALKATARPIRKIPIIA
jgi:hypothetical protein